jgi:hypothetical protein
MCRSNGILFSVAACFSVMTAAGDADIIGSQPGGLWTKLRNV